jgi:hypothetical protein
MINNNNLRVDCLCADCGEVLNSTRKMTAAEIHKNWTLIVMGSPLNVGKCPKGCRSTYSDCNANTNIIIVDNDTNIPIDKDLFFKKGNP